MISALKCSSLIELNFWLFAHFAVISVQQTHFSKKNEYVVAVQRYLISTVYVFTVYKQCWLM